MTDRLHLQPKHREALLREHLPDVEVWAYGSRVNGRSHDGSDLDLVLCGPELIPVGNVAHACVIQRLLRLIILPKLIDQSACRSWMSRNGSAHRGRSSGA